MNSKLKTLLRAGLAASAVLVLQACGPADSATPSAAPPEVSVMTVHRSSVPITIELPGRTSAYLVAQVRARVDGIVLQRAFKEGGDVKVGQRLYQIDPAPYIASLNSATASLQKAEANLASTAALVERYKGLVAADFAGLQPCRTSVAVTAARPARRRIFSSNFTWPSLRLDLTSTMAMCRLRFVSPRPRRVAFATAARVSEPVAYSSDGGPWIPVTFVTFER